MGERGVTDVKVLGIDVGGSEIKGAVVDTTSGRLVAHPQRHPTPDPSDPASLGAVVRAIVTGLAWDGAIGCAFPAPIFGGTVTTADNIDASWVGLQGGDVLTAQLGRSVHLLNDGDAAALAEHRFGAARAPGTVLVLTFGTGIGSALLRDGHLVPNTELGHLRFGDTDLETYAAASAIARDGLDDAAWSARANEAMRHLCDVIAPDRIVVGGGISERFEQLRLGEGVPAPVVPARLGNDAGIVGAALAAAADATSSRPTTNGVGASQGEQGLPDGMLLSTTSRSAAADGRTTEGAHR